MDYGLTTALLATFCMMKYWFSMYNAVTYLYLVNWKGICPPGRCSTLTLKEDYWDVLKPQHIAAAGEHSRELHFHNVRKELQSKHPPDHPDLLH